MNSFLKIALAHLLVLIPILAPGGATAAETGTGVVASGRAERFRALQSVAQRQGEVALIVRFDDVDVPLPALPPQAQQARMDAMRSVRERLLGELAGWGRLTNVKRFEYTPHVAFSADARVLGVLEFHPLALEVVEDELRAPTLQQTIPLVHADTGAWTAGSTGAGRTIAILDSGVDKTHPFLAGKVVSEACYSTTSAPYGSTSLCPNGQDSTAAGSGVNCSGISGCDHGTHVAGIAAGKDPGGTGRNGVAKDATLIAIQVFSRFDNPAYCGSSTPCILSWSSDQMQALERVYALRSNYAIASANMSLGGGRYYAACDGDSLKASIDSLRAVGTAVAIASGNNGYKDSISAPACISSAISVGSSCDSSNGYCSGVDAIAGYSNIASFVSLLAPGSVVTSSVPGGGYASWHGTSMATPHVAGAWAVKQQSSPGASVSAILDDLRSSGVTVDDTRSGGSVTGMKRIDFAVATSHTLTVSRSGSGTVTSAPTGIDCGATCAASFASGTAVTLTAVPTNGYAFAGWGGACSGTGSCVVTMNAAAVVAATFQAANSAPTAVADSYSGFAGSTMNVTAPGVLANDTDADGNALTAVLASGPAHGTLTLASNGGFTYTPTAGYSGPDSFSYRASDGQLTSAAATVSITVAPAPTCTLPAPPTGLTAKGLPKLRIQLAWTDASSNESGFRIERSVDGGATWPLRASVGSNATTYTDSGLTAGQTYRYRVKAWSACGESGPTNTASATPRR